MGIPGYFSHIVRKYRNVIKPIEELHKTVDNLYLDCNGFIYNAYNDIITKTTKNNSFTNDNMQHMSSNAPHRHDCSTDKGRRIFETMLIRNACSNIGSIILKLRPTGKIMIAFDGVAPLAKMSQQRNRRYMTAYNDIIKNKHPNRGKNIDWDTNSITPGTVFMRNLGTAVKDYFGKNKDEFNFTQHDIIVSGSDVPGEGEHKIFEYIRDNKEYHAGTCTVIYGVDADLIMLSLNHLHISSNIFLYRETPEFIKSIDDTLSPDNTYIIDILALSTDIIREISPDTKSTDTKSTDDVETAENIQSNNNLVSDYIFMCFLLGNDFLPHFPSLNIRTHGIIRLIGTYKLLFGLPDSKYYKRSLTYNDEIIWDNAFVFMKNLAEKEHDYILDEYTTRSKESINAYRPRGYKNKIADYDPTLLMPLKDRQRELSIDPYNPGWETRYYCELFTDNGILYGNEQRDICINYIQGLEWTMKYYYSGCIDWNWTYHYCFPPLMSDIVLNFPSINGIVLIKQDKAPVKPIVQLSYVLPPGSLYLIHPEAVNILLYNHPEWYTYDYKFYWAFCKFFWESHVVLPYINIKQLSKLLDTF